ncbi:MAG TPA: hypothetical protein PKA58_05300, partial [Polyangium sp.]|nr:hypothetical protein [Polyangium sp.]
MRLGLLRLGAGSERKGDRGEDEEFPNRLHGGRSVPQKLQLVTNPRTSCFVVIARSTDLPELCYNTPSNVRAHEMPRIN